MNHRIDISTDNDGAQWFDAVASNYDQEFTHTPLGERKRQIVHAYLKNVLSHEMRVLELNCGTGEDALLLSPYVTSITSTDASRAMLSVAQEKIRSANVKNVSIRHMRIEELWETQQSLSLTPPFDIVFSNFDGINCLSDISPLPAAASSLLSENGEIILVIISPFCLVETLGFGLKGKFGKASQRFRRDGLSVHIGNGQNVMTYFHSVKTIRQRFAIDFRLKAIRGIGLTSPPTSMRDFYRRHTALFKSIESIEDALSSYFPWNRMCDHILFHFQKRT